MHPTDDLVRQYGLTVARAAAVATGSGLGARGGAVAEAHPTEAECAAYMKAHPLEGFTILPTLEIGAFEVERLQEDDGA